MLRRIAALAVLVPLAACADGLDTAPGALAEGTPEAIGVLRFLNGPDADVRTLDVDARLDARAARNIVAHVRGPDGVLGTADDDLLDSIDELDAIPWVGPATLDRLLAYVEAIGGVPRHVCDGVLLTDAEAAAVLRAAGGATERELDHDARLDARAARNLVAARPIADLDALAAVPYVGPAAVERLRVWAPGWASAEAACHPGVLQGMRACVEGQLDELSIDDAAEVCAGAEAFGPVFDAVCAAPGAPAACDLDFEAAWRALVPPCAARLADELAPLCVRDADCGGAPRRCQGIPQDGSSSLGVCADTRARPGEGDPCDPARPCAAGLVCAGLTLWDDGVCVGDWMAGAFAVDVPVAVPAAGGTTRASAVVVRGLASVPVDVEVEVDLDGLDPRRLRLRLTDPNGDAAVVWDGATQAGPMPARLNALGAISRDDRVNGRWTLSVTTLGAGAAGAIAGWRLHVTSRWD